jgi:hypothetical protein
MIRVNAPDGRVIHYPGDTPIHAIQAHLDSLFQTPEMMPAHAVAPAPIPAHNKRLIPTAAPEPIPPSTVTGGGTGSMLDFNQNTPNTILGQLGTIGDMGSSLLRQFGGGTDKTYETLDTQNFLPGQQPAPGSPRFVTSERYGAMAPPFAGGAAGEEEDLLRSFERMKKHMRPEVAEVLDKGMKTRIASAYSELPPAAEWEAAARAGVAKRGWYKNSGAAIKSMFGTDTPLFTGVLAATSPRQTVADNLKMATRVFGAWVDAGRPESAEEIMKVLETVPGASMGSRVPNQIRALQGKPLVDFVEPGAGGSGWKVESFRRNLLGEMDYSTNDTWMAKFIGKNGDWFGSKANYLAADAMARQVGKRMGWETAEVQETVWSWMKTLIEQTPSSSTLKEGLKGVTHELIAQDPDFATLLSDPEIAKELERAGFKPPAATGSRPGTTAANIGREEGGDPRVLERVVRRLKRQGIEPVGAAKPRIAAPSPPPPSRPPR